jgi:predicted metal-dependent phosphoesterase TrpH
MIKVEFHCHTCYSKDSLVRLQRLASTCQAKGIHRLVITDHNTIEGALLAQEIDPYRFIVGEEVMTQQGELIATFVREHIPANLPAVKTIEILRAQGAFIAIAHPFDVYRHGHWELSDLHSIVEMVDAVEVFNARCIHPQANRQAKNYAMQYHLPTIVGSDAHSLLEVGHPRLPCLILMIQPV